MFLKYKNMHTWKENLSNIAFGMFSSLLQLQKYSMEDFMVNVFQFSIVIATEYLTHFPWRSIFNGSLYNNNLSTLVKIVGLGSGFFVWFVGFLIYLFIFKLMTATFHHSSAKTLSLYSSFSLTCLLLFISGGWCKVLLMKKQSVISIWELFIPCANNVLI